MYQVLRLYGLAALVASTLSAPSKSVNVEFETSVLFEPKDTEKHLKFIHSVRNVLDKLEDAIQPKFRYRSVNKQENISKPHESRYEYETTVKSEDRILTNFVNDLIRTISQFHAVDVQIFFTKLDSEMKTQFYKGSVFREMVYDPKLQTYLRNKLKEFAVTDSGEMKFKLMTHVERSKKHDIVFDAIGRLNEFYDEKDGAKMRAILDKLAKPRSHLANIIKEAIDYFIYGHYDKMNYTSRAKFADEVNKLAALVNNKHIDKDLKLTFRTSEVRAKESIDAFESNRMNTDFDNSLENDNAKYNDREMDYYENFPSETRRNKNKINKENIKDSVLRKTEKLIQDMVEHVSEKLSEGAKDKQNKNALNIIKINESKEKNEVEIIKKSKEIIPHASLNKERDKYDTLAEETKEIIEQAINPRRTINKEKEDTINKQNKDKDTKRKNNKESKETEWLVINEESKYKDTINEKNKVRYAHVINEDSKDKDTINKESKKGDGHVINEESKDKATINKESKERYRRVINEEMEDTINKDSKDRHRSVRNEESKDTINKESKESHRRVRNEEIKDTIKKERKERHQSVRNEESKDTINKESKDTISKESKERYRRVRNEEIKDTINKESKEKDKQVINEKSKGKDTINKEREGDEMYKDNTKTHEDAISKERSGESEEDAKNKEKDKHSLNKEIEEKYEIQRDGLSIPLSYDEISNSSANDGDGD